MKKKCKQIKKEKYEEVEIEFDSDKLLELCLVAHKKDITLNKLCNNILKDEIKKLK